MKQRRLPGINFRFRKSYGGSEIKGKRKIKRPFSPKKFLHLVFRSENVGPTYSMLNKRSEIELILLHLVERYGIALEQYTNAGNHLHLFIRAKTRINLQKFLKSFARQVAKVKIGRAHV